ncbi:putative exosome complex exonuclease [Monocercomonoides exilis]|uniref:putative exosome complex exonuclease n=1 Tax=Monocercomonoides exilis TaxID=2049356 RepID=UPI00355A7232|nr:putative exosome complex exonuclease [Monocercomonoides exilis]|eukprot:MONOS_3865.1-p1 / transcript=MONOS_3865.1 / gene=MONOS_3865 / organism=Monocercomonoides_exilis_PA203 / gene_product=Putative exosome complex exonuclease RMONOS_16807 / transcript_product=Putative exosome complex exonuclease RMONOS_16807 / location=Mono_scaffold00095:47280-48323(-) / protein_length=239 / sequence_SO=supercontig / SO=protein_coding / is_pseudo=false
MGKTKVICAVTGRMSTPKKERPSDGQIHVKVHFSPLGSPEYDLGRLSVRCLEIARIVERGIRESGSISTRALCVLATVHVWDIDVNIHIIDDCGNVIDASLLAAFAALLNFKKLRTSIVSDKLIVHPASELRPVPLTLLHVPVSATFALFSSPFAALLDPTEEEEKVADGFITIISNSRRKICGIEKSGGPALSPMQILEMSRISISNAIHFHRILTQTKYFPEERNSEGITLDIPLPE